MLCPDVDPVNFAILYWSKCGDEVIQPRRGDERQDRSIVGVLWHVFYFLTGDPVDTQVAGV